MSFMTVWLDSLLIFCCKLCDSTIGGIFLFTFVTKIFLFPLSLWCQSNSLKMVGLLPEINELKIHFAGDHDFITERERELFRTKHYHPLLSLIPLAVQIFLLFALIESIQKIVGSSDSFLVKIPVRDGGWSWLAPCLAGISAAIFGQTQNYQNPLQHEQSSLQQWITNSISIGISVFLGSFVAFGVALYWIASNIFSIFVQIGCNFVLPPPKYVNYFRLRKSQILLRKLEKIKKSELHADDRKRERQDYKRFFSVAGKHLVYYSEKAGFYKYFSEQIDYLLKNSNIIIHYITSDPADPIFEFSKREPRIQAYFIGPYKLISCFLKMDADMVIMTMPDLGTFQYKRSRISRRVEYVYTEHAISSTHLTVRESAYDNFDTFFCTFPQQKEELRKMEELRRTRKKKLVECGYGLLDILIKEYSAMPPIFHDIPTIMIAPSWQKDNILDTVLDTLLAELGKGSCQIILRPHPEYVKRYTDRWHNILLKYKNVPRLTIESDFSSNKTVYTSDLLITDWSGIAYEFSLTTLHPVLFIDTPVKIMNPRYQKIGIQPMDIAWRNQVGIAVPVNEIGNIATIAAKILHDKDLWKQRILKVRSELFCVGKSGEAAGKYILRAIWEKQRIRNLQNNTGE